MSKSQNAPIELTLITTGGTLDGTCHDLGIVGGPSVLRTTLNSDSSLSVTTVTVCNKDSRDIDDNDRRAMLAEILKEPTGRVLIGHGTYTICETGRFLQTHLGSISKRVLLLGAWIPLEHENSDAVLQITFAIKSILSCSPGVFVSMDGRLWNPSSTEKRQDDIGKWKLVDLGHNNSVDFTR